MSTFTVTTPVYDRRPSAAPARRSSYDAARTTDANRKHWANADGLSAPAALTPEVRKRLRDRARYEVVNNCYAAGAVRTLVNDTVGTGARPQFLTPDAGLNSALEELWSQWACAADFPLTSRVACGVRHVAGEVFGRPRSSARLARLGLPVTLDVRLYEPEQVSHGVTGLTVPPTAGDDGVVCDADGEVVAYKILGYHPGDTRPLSARLEPVTVPADDVFHWYVPDRPGQLRGVTPLTPALPVLAQLRRYTLAVLTAAETAASFAGVLTQDVPPGEAPVDAEAFDTVEIVSGMLLTLPAGAKAEQFKPEQPTTNYDAFVAAKLRECGRAINMPYGKLAGDHSLYNYSSGRLDDAPYWQDRDIERRAFEAKFLNPVLYRWLDEARYEFPALMAWQGRGWWAFPHVWHYDARPSSDPVKDATGDELNLANGADTLAAIAARDGTTVTALLDQREREMAMFKERGLPLPAWLTGGTAAAKSPTAGPQSNPQEAAAHG